MIIIPIRFSLKPVLIISEMVMRSDPKTMALEGVAVGNIKASDDAIVAGTINNSGLSPVDTAIAANAGKSI